MALFSHASVVLCLIATLAGSNALQAINGKIKITTGTTAGCSDTVAFIGNQLAQAYEEYRDFLELEFVPWGRTARLEDGTLDCQFGERDCWANRVHRCALDLLKNNNDAKMHYMTCEFTGSRPAFLLGTYLCAQAVGLSLVDLDYCISTSGDVLESQAEAAASEPMEIINFVPSIHFNDDVDVNLHNQARTRLSSLICFALAEDPSTGITDCQI